MEGEEGKGPSGERVLTTNTLVIESGARDSLKAT